MNAAPGRFRDVPGLFAVGLLLLGISPLARAQAPEAPPVISPDVQATGHVVFRIKAPEARAVRVVSPDVPGVTKENAALKKGKDGLWEATLGPIPPGVYRYTFDLDGVSVVDPRNPSNSESNNNVWSLVRVPGAAFMDTRSVPHGAVSEVTYFSTVLQRFRRMHVYTPPGYGTSPAKYPVFFLLHGSSDSDNSWSTVGRAGFILDNLIFDKKAKPMIVVMPHGHTTAIRSPSNNDDFAREFMADIAPAIDHGYRVLPGRANRAIAGLSMGGGQTLAIAIPNLDRFAYIGVFSSSMPGMPRAARPGVPNPPAPEGPTFEEKNKAALANPALKKGLKLFWIGTGKDDFGVENTRKTVEIFKGHGFTPEYLESEGGHVWMNWRDYLNVFAPRLFQGK
jgi:enterochelin esterase-like enzyme